MTARQAHERRLDATGAIRRRLTARRELLLGSAKLVGGGALALAAVGAPAGRAVRSALAQDEVDVSTPVAVLNYALTLELLENAFYRDGLAGFAADDFDEGVFDSLTLIGGHEADHVDVLTDTIGQLGGTPVAEAEYDFGEAFEDPAMFLATAQALENTGVSAYTGAAQFLIDEDELLTAALTIHGVEARHASYLNRINGAQPFPTPVDAPLTPDQVMAIATPFIVTAAATGTGGTTASGGAAAGGTGPAAGTGTNTGPGASGGAAPAGGSGPAATGGMNLPTTGTGSAYRASGSDRAHLGEGLALVGLAGVGAVAVAAVRRGATARGDERG